MTRSTSLLATPAQVDQAHVLLDHAGRHPLHLVAETNAARADVPPELADILHAVLRVLTEGGSLTVETLPAQLTTGQAARLLGESRPTLMKRIHNGQLPSTLVGTHHRVATADVLALRQARLDARRAEALEFLALEDELAL